MSECDVTRHWLDVKCLNCYLILEKKYKKVLDFVKEVSNTGCGVYTNNDHTNDAKELLKEIGEL